jgi:hypothetical protein
MGFRGRENPMVKVVFPYYEQDVNEDSGKTSLNYLEIAKDPEMIKKALIPFEKPAVSSKPRRRDGRWMSAKRAKKSFPLLAKDISKAADSVTDCNLRFSDQWYCDGNIKRRQKPGIWFYPPQRE